MKPSALNVDSPLTDTSSTGLHALTVDVEDFNCLAIREYLDKAAAPQKAVLYGTYKLLDLFAMRRVSATFFFLGEVAKSFPSLVRSVADAGHEIAVHGYSHRKFFDMRPSVAFNEVYRAKCLLEDISGVNVAGHRAPAFSINSSTAWAFEVLSLAGFNYDSSVMPFRGRRYGWPGFPEHIHKMALSDGKSLIEAPMPVMRLWNIRRPVGGGGHLRHFPYTYTSLALNRVASYKPVIIYIHPYDVDTVSTYSDFQNPMRKSGLRRKVNLRLQYRSRHSVMAKLGRLLSDFKFTTLSAVIDDVFHDEPSVPSGRSNEQSTF